MKLWKIDAIRGVVFGLLGVAVGMVIAVLVRFALGLPAWKWEQAAFVGTVVGILFYLWGLGAFSYWVRRWVLRRAADAQHPEEQRPHGWRRYLSFDTNHKTIGIQYLVTALLVIAVAGVYQLIARIETSAPGIQFLRAPQTYYSLISLHGIMMLGAVLLAISGLMNYLVPLMIGAKDMAFPRLNALSYWLTPPAVLLFAFSLVAGGFDTGWTAYPPLSVKAPLGMQLMLMAFYVVGWSSILGGVNFLTTIFRMRAPGMGLFRMPIFVWAVVATTFLALIFTQSIATAFLLVVLERVTGMGFFDPTRGGQPLLFQQLFWFYSHPAVYVFVLPGLGIISELLPVFSRKPLFGYRAVALSSIGIAVGGSFVWMHHMFAAGIPTWLTIPFMFSTLLVAVPTGVKVFAWLATMWRGKIRLELPMLFVITSISVFLIGGITGVPLGIVPVDLYVTDTYWIPAHFHFTLFGGFVFPLMAAFYYWFPKVTGRFLGQKLGFAHWVIMTAGYYITYLPMFWLGLNGMRRRISDYDPALGLGPMNVVVTIGGYMIGLAMLFFFINLVLSLRKGQPAPENPWQARTLEWQVSSPPPEENFEVTPEVVDGPYGYGIPGSTHAITGQPATPFKIKAVK